MLIMFDFEFDALLAAEMLRKVQCAIVARFGVIKGLIKINK